MTHIKIMFGLSLILACVVSVPAAQGKRAAPPEVPPVVMQGLRISISNEPSCGGALPDNSKVQQHGGCLEIWDLQNNKKLREILVYRTDYKPDLESDVQDVWISSMSVEGDRLVVRNELGEEYQVDLKTKSISKTKEVKPDNLTLRGTHLP